MLPWLQDNDPFPCQANALQEPNGLLAAGADLSPRRLLMAYRQGIFPWYSSGQPVLWWSPDPRSVLLVADFQPSRSLRKQLRRGDYQIRADDNFAAVVRACAQSYRQGQDGTWILPEMQQAYIRLHQLGYAHSVETWIDGELAGGIYGVAIGRAFFGESMFFRRCNASKLAFAHLLRFLQQTGYELIDCQMTTPHLTSLGAVEIPRAKFIERLAALVNCSPPGIAPTVPWRRDALSFVPESW